MKRITPRHALAFTGLTAMLVIGVAPAAFATNMPHIQDYIDGPCEFERTSAFVADNSGNERPETYTISDGTPPYVVEVPAHAVIHSPKFSIPASGAHYTITAGDQSWTFTAQPDSACPPPVTESPAPSTTPTAPPVTSEPSVPPVTDEPSTPAEPTGEPTPSTPSGEPSGSPKPSEPTHEHTTPVPSSTPTTPNPSSSPTAPVVVTSAPSASASASPDVSLVQPVKSDSPVTTLSAKSSEGSDDALAYTGSDSATQTAWIVFAMWAIGVGVLAVTLKSRRA